MTVALPQEEGVIDKTLDALVDLVTLRLKTEVHEDDASRLVWVGVGFKQDDPEGVDIALHENDPDTPSGWPHRPESYRAPKRLGGLVGTPPLDSAQEQLRTFSGMEKMGGGSRMTRRFTAVIMISADEINDINPTRRDVGQLGTVVENRLLKTLIDAGPKIGTGKLITGNFGETVSMGPFFGDAWTDYEEGEAYRLRKYVRFGYHTTRAWNVSDW
jgi:hypothetical protein